MMEMSARGLCMKRLRTHTKKIGVTISGFAGSSKIRNKDINHLIAKAGAPLFINKETKVVKIE
jgi:hypothetical protein